MISCAYALLFFGDNVSNRASTSSHLPHQKEIHTKTVHGPQSLVFLADGLQSSFYGAYEFPHDGHFPRPRAGSDIIITIELPSDIVTKVVAYCSLILSSTEIIKTFEYNLIPMSKNYYTESTPMTDSERICGELVQEDWYELMENQSLWPKILAQNDKCSSRDIISLAHRGLLSVTGVFSEMTPTYKNENVKKNTKNTGSSVDPNEVPKVDIKSRVDLHEMVSPEQVFGTQIYLKKREALVWYFGHLHLFERSLEDKVWWPKTKIELDHRNGATLLYFMRHNMKLFKKLDARIAEYGFLYRAANSISCSSCIPLHTEEKSEKIMAELRHVLIKRIKIPNEKFLIEPM